MGLIDIIKSQSRINVISGQKSFPYNRGGKQKPNRPLKAFYNPEDPCQTTINHPPFRPVDAGLNGQPAACMSLFEKIHAAIKRPPTNLNNLFESSGVGFGTFSEGDASAFNKQFDDILKIEFDEEKNRPLKKDGISIHNCAIHRKNGTSESAYLVKHSGYGGRQQKLELDSNGRSAGKGAGGFKFVQQALLIPELGPLWDCCKIPISSFSLSNIVLTYAQ